MFGSLWCFVGFDVQQAAREEGEDIYGRTHVATENSTVVKKYVPPARRRQLAREAAAAAAALAASGGRAASSAAAKAAVAARCSNLQKEVKGLFNRLSDANLGWFGFILFLLLFEWMSIDRHTQCLHLVVRIFVVSAVLFPFLIIDLLHLPI